MSITFGKPRFVDEDELLGESYENISMCYGGANRTTIAHELMHSLGLNHTFSNFRRHTNNNENLLDFSIKNNADGIIFLRNKLKVLWKKNNMDSNLLNTKVHHNH